MAFIRNAKALFLFSQLFGLAPLKLIDGRLCVDPRLKKYTFVVLGLFLVLQSFIFQDYSGTTRLATSRAADLLDTYGFALTCLGAFISHICQISEVCRLLNKIIDLRSKASLSTMHPIIDIIAGLAYEVLFSFISIYLSPFENLNYNYYILETLTYVALELVAYIIFLQFYHLVLHSGRLFRSVNRKLALMKYQALNVRRKKRFIQSIKQSSMYYASVYDICENINDVFAVQNLLHVALCCLEVTYSFYLGIVKNHESGTNVMADTVLWAGYFFYKLLVTLSVCSITKSESKRTAVLLQELADSVDDNDVKIEIEIFSLQLLHTDVTFDAFGFFKLDFSLIYSVTGAVTSYLMLLVQSHNKPIFTWEKNCTLHA